MRRRLSEKKRSRTGYRSRRVGYSSRGSWARARHQDGGRGRSPRLFEKPFRHEKTPSRRSCDAGRVRLCRCSRVRRTVPSLLSEIQRLRLPVQCVQPILCQRREYQQALPQMLCPCGNSMQCRLGRCLRGRLLRSGRDDRRRSRREWRSAHSGTAGNGPERPVGRPTGARAVARRPRSNVARARPHDPIVRPSAYDARFRRSGVLEQPQLNPVRRPFPDGRSPASALAGLVFLTRQFISLGGPCSSG
jgi:hypothetical protein